MKNRSRTEIFAQILEAAVGGTTKTKLMYKTYLNHAQLIEYLAVLAENGLLEYEKKTSGYKTTEKGTRFLKIHEQLDQMMISGPLVVGEKLNPEQTAAKNKVHKVHSNMKSQKKLEQFG